jgi:hypothetical protein
VKRFRWPFLLGASLLALSALFYYIHWLIFRDAHHIFIYLIGDIAFVFIEVLLVTLILHELLTLREKISLLEKLNMVIGTFFSEAGLALLKNLADRDRNAERIRKDLLVRASWTAREFADTSRKLKQHRGDIEVCGADLETLRGLLVKHREFFLRLLENPVLLEHDAFTNVLTAVFHLADELSARTDLAHMTETDCRHIEVDMQRVYGQLITAWLDYMKHLHDHFPYLFSFAMRTNPFDPDAAPEVK